MEFNNFLDRLNEEIFLPPHYMLAFNKNVKNDEGYYISIMSADNGNRMSDKVKPLGLTMSNKTINGVCSSKYKFGNTDYIFRKLSTSKDDLTRDGEHEDETPRFKLNKNDPVYGKDPSKITSEYTIAFDKNVKDDEGHYVSIMSAVSGSKMVEKTKLLGSDDVVSGINRACRLQTGFHISRYTFRKPILNKDFLTRDGEHEDETPRFKLNENDPVYKAFKPKHKRDAFKVDSNYIVAFDRDIIDDEGYYISIASATTGQQMADKIELLGKTLNKNAPSVASKNQYGFRTSKYTFRKPILNKDFLTRDGEHEDETPRFKLNKNDPAYKIEINNLSRPALKDDVDVVELDILGNFVKDWSKETKKIKYISKKLNLSTKKMLDCIEAYEQVHNPEVTKENDIKKTDIDGRIFIYKKDYKKYTDQGLTVKPQNIIANDDGKVTRRYHMYSEHGPIYMLNKDDYSIVHKFKSIKEATDLVLEEELSDLDYTYISKYISGALNGVKNIITKNKRSIVSYLDHVWIWEEHYNIIKDSDRKISEIFKRVRSLGENEISKVLKKKYKKEYSKHVKEEENFDHKEYDYNNKMPDTNWSKRLDFVVRDSKFKLFIEYHGEQHYRKIKFWQKTNKKFKQQTHNDHIRREKSKHEGYHHLEIGYKEKIEDIPRIVKSFINEIENKFLNPESPGYQKLIKREYNGTYHSSVDRSKKRSDKGEAENSWDIIESMTQELL